MYKLVRQFDDGEMYSDGKRHVLVVYGFATGSEMGVHCLYNTMVCIYVWEGDNISIENLPRLKDKGKEGWKPLRGFNVDIEGNEYDWDNYYELVKDALDEIYGGDL